METSPGAAAAAPGFLLPLYALTLFLGAFLLFWVQPMFAKMILPTLGGSPAVWNTAMLFFQTALLAGYAYAHFLSRTPRGSQALAHVALLAIAAVLLPIGMAEGWTPPTEGSPVFWMIGLMAVSIGPPFLAVSATAPLLQRWFAASAHRLAHDPYFLYAASNLGSMAGLLGYPLLLEPALTLQRQTGLWSALYLLLAAMIVLAGFAARDLSANGFAALEAEPAKAPPITWRQRLHWLALAFVPSSLLLGVTQHITTDLAAAPLLWVGPLAIYLLTFVLVFSRTPLLRHEWMVRILPPLLVMLALFFGVIGNLWLTIGLHVFVFFVCAMVCHGELARARPGPNHLTEFYLWLSFGGMLGGVFNALTAPMLFDGVYEYPLALALACLLYPRDRSGAARAKVFDLLLPAGLLAFVLGVLNTGAVSLGGFDKWKIFLVFAVVGVAVLSFAERPVRFALGLAVAMTPSMLFLSPADVLERSRSFFGVYKVQSERNGKFLALTHGTTYHGAVGTDPALRHEPLIYYSRQGPLGQIHKALETDPGIRRVATIGVGLGAHACYRRPGQSWTFFEIDPEVVRIAGDQRYFHMFADCAKDARVKLGDGRLKLSSEPDAAFDLLVIDVFSSDVVPIHLLTREALKLYRDKLAAHGILVIHISNRHLDLAPVLAAGAADAGLIGFQQQHDPGHEARQNDFITASHWAVFARSAEALAPILRSQNWQPLVASKGAPVWTDDYSNLIGALKAWRTP